MANASPRVLGLVKEVIYILENSHISILHPGASSERTWDVYVTTVMEDHLADETCATSLAPWMQVRLPKTDTLDWKPIEDKVRSSLPLRLISLDLLATIGDEPPLWIDLRSLEGEPMPQGYTPAVRVRSGDYGETPTFRVVVLLMSADFQSFCVLDAVCSSGTSRILPQHDFHHPVV